jgi:hypothetical protein
MANAGFKWKILRIKDLALKGAVVVGGMFRTAGYFFWLTTM